MTRLRLSEELGPEPPATWDLLGAAVAVAERADSAGALCTGPGGRAHPAAGEKLMLLAGLGVVSGQEA
jgi:hypothetical protein